MKKKKLVKNALKHPELHAPAELSFFERWLRERKERKERFTNVNKKYTEDVETLH